MKLRLLVLVCALAAVGCTTTASAYVSKKPNSEFTPENLEMRAELTLSKTW